MGSNSNSKKEEDGVEDEVGNNNNNGERVVREALAEAAQGGKATALLE